MNDYIITVDLDGQPYIEHAWGNRWANKSHKYIMKIGEGAKARYLYTQEEVRAYMQGGRQKGQNVANKARVAGQRAMQPIRNVRTKINNFERSAKAVNKRTGETYTGKEAVQKLREAAKEYKKEIKSQKSSAPKERKPFVQITTTTTDKNGNKTVKTGKEAAKEVGHLVKEQVKQNIDEKYGHKIRNAKNDIEDAKSAVRDAGNKLKSTSDRMKDEFRKKKEEAAKNVKNVVGADERDYLNTAKKELSDAKEKSKRADKRLARANDKTAEIDSHGQRWFKTEKEAREAGDAELNAIRSANDVKNKEKSVEYFKDRYDKTPLGKVENAKDKLAERVNQAKDTYKKLSDKAKDLAGADERKKFDAAWEKVMKAEPGSKAQEKALDEFMEVRKAYFKTPMGKADYGTARINEILSGSDGTPKEIAKDLADKANDKLAERVNQAKDTYKKLSDKAKDLAGADERKRFDSAMEKVMRAESGSEEQSRALDAFEKARDAYLKTPMGKVDYGTERAKEILSGADGTPKEIAKDLVDKAKDQLGFDELDRRNKAKEEYDKSTKEFRKAENERKELSGRRTGDEEYEKAYEKADKAYSKNMQDIRNLSDAQKDLNKTIVGKVDNITSPIKDVINKSKENNNYTLAKRVINQSQKEFNERNNVLSKEYAGNKEFEIVSSKIAQTYGKAARATSYEEQREILEDLTPLLKQYNGYIREYNSKKK